MHCVACGIRFLTHPRNAGRVNLRCPFGCRRHHRRQCSSQRSAAYYRTASGKVKKNRLNARRSGGSATAAGVVEDDRSPQSLVPPAEASQPPLPDGLSGKLELPLPGVVLDEPSVMHSPLLPYVRMLVNLIEGARFSCQEIADLLGRSLRQHSIARRSRSDYVLCFLHQHPP